MSGVPVCRHLDPRDSFSIEVEVKSREELSMAERGLKVFKLWDVAEKKWTTVDPDSGVVTAPVDNEWIHVREIWQRRIVKPKF